MFTESLDYWKLCDEFTVVQAALLIIGENPEKIQECILDWNSESRPNGFNAVFSALTHAIFGKRLNASIVETEGVGESWIEWRGTSILREDLIDWLAGRNFKPAFFFEKTSDAPNYLDPKHPKYSPKLAAAIRAWEAVTTDQKYSNNGKTPKANIENWLHSHAAEYGLLKEDGDINADAIKNQIAKVSNWQTDGGAPKTPSK